MKTNTTRGAVGVVDEHNHDNNMQHESGYNLTTITMVI